MTTNRCVSALGLVESCTALGAWSMLWRLVMTFAVGPTIVLAALQRGSFVAFDFACRYYSTWFVSSGR